MMENRNINASDIQKTLQFDTKETHKRSWLWYVVMILIAAAGIGGYFFFSASQHKKVNYITKSLEKKDLVITVSATGNLEPTNVVDVGIEVSGTISHVYADFNLHVKKGDILAELDTTKLEARVKNSKAALLVSKANLSEKKVALDDAKNELIRGNKMYQSTQGKYPSDKEMDALNNGVNRAKAGYDAAVAGVAQADAQLKSDEDDLKKAVVRAPISGIVLDRKIEEGQSVVSSMQIPVLFTLAEDLTKMEAVLGIDEADIGHIKEAQVVKFTVDAYADKTFTGTITQVRFNSIIVSGVVTYETVVSVDNSELLLRPGMTASAEIITKEIKNTYAVSNAALRFSPHNDFNATNGKDILWILDKGIPKRIKISAGESNGVMTQISGELLQEGLPVIVNSDKAP